MRGDNPAGVRMGRRIWQYLIAACDLVAKVELRVGAGIQEDLSARAY
jgi:hypothetical protein